jgi:hypothetical protein
VSVAGPSRYGNPHEVIPDLCTAREAVQRFEADLLAGRLPVSVSDVRRALAGKDKAGKVS